MASDQKIKFIVMVRDGGGFSANAVGFPIHAEGPHMRDLRTSVRKAANRHFGQEVPVALMVGGSAGDQPLRAD